MKLKRVVLFSVVSLTGAIGLIRSVAAMDRDDFVKECRTMSPEDVGVEKNCNCLGEKFSSKERDFFIDSMKTPKGKYSSVDRQSIAVMQQYAEKIDKCIEEVGDGK
jgi:hypothetical protein